MKRFALALPVVAAWALFCLPALAGDAAATASILPEPVKAHWVAGLFLVICAAVRTGLSNDTIHLPTVAAPWRAVIVAGVAALGAGLEGWNSNLPFSSIMLTFVALGLPPIVQEILKVVFGAKNAGGGKAMFPPAALG